MSSEPTYLKLLQNIAFLLSLILLFNLSRVKVSGHLKIAKQVLIGILIGGIGLLIMLSPWEVSPGIIFDTRSVLLCISGLFFGLIPTIIAMGMTLAFRVFQGGGGALTGSLVILATGVIGILWRYLRKKPLEQTNWWGFYIFGFIVHLVMLALMFTLPKASIQPVLASVSFPVMAIYPFGTMLLGLVLRNRLNRDAIQEELLKVNHEFISLIEEAPVGIVIYENNGSIYFVNRTFSEVTGYTLSDIPDINAWWPVVYPDEEYRNDMITKWGNAVLETKTGNLMAMPLKTRIRKKDGSFCVLEVGYVASGQRNIVTFIDITKRLETEEKLQESEERFRNLLDSAPVGIAVVSDRKIDYANPAAIRLVGGTQLDQVIGKPISDYVDPTMLEVTNQEVDRFISGEESASHFENIYRKLDGSKMYVETIRTRIIYQGKPSIQVIFTDITERKALEEKRKQDQETLERLLEDAEHSRKALLSLIEDHRAAEEEIRTLNKELEGRVQQRTAQLEASNKELEAFAYSVSHDLRAPLRAIQGFSQILEDGYSNKIDREGMRLLDVIQINAQKMDKLIVDLLSLSRVRRGDLKISKINMKSMVISIFQELEPNSDKEKIEFIVHELPPIFADPTLIHQVWTNLISNAIKYSAPKEHRKIEISGFVENESVIFSIKDNGVGFEPQNAEKIFGLFQRSHNDRDFEGSGIGLAIVERIIERHHGKVWSNGKPGEGAEFFFSIPQKKEPQWGG